MGSAVAMLLDRLGPPGFRFTDFRVRPSRCCSTGSGRLDLDLLISGPRVNLTYQPYARADGQAVVCPLLRGSSPTRGVAPKQHRGLRRAFSPAFRAGSLDPLARGCRRIWRGEGWFRPARCCSTGSGRRDLDLLISGPRVNLSYQPYARGGADGQAGVCPLLRGSSPTRGVAPKQHRGLRRAFSPAFFVMVLLLPWRVGAEQSGRRDAARPAPAARILVFGFGRRGARS